MFLPLHLSGGLGPPGRVHSTVHRRAQLIPPTPFTHVEPELSPFDPSPSPARAQPVRSQPEPSPSEPSPSPVERGIYFERGVSSVVTIMSAEPSAVFRAWDLIDGAVSSPLLPPFFDIILTLPPVAATGQLMSWFCYPLWHQGERGDDGGFGRCLDFR